MRAAKGFWLLGTQKPFLPPPRGLKSVLEPIWLSIPHSLAIYGIDFGSTQSHHSLFSTAGIQPQGVRLGHKGVCRASIAFHPA